DSRFNFLERIGSLTQKTPHPCFRNLKFDSVMDFRLNFATAYIHFTNPGSIIAFRASTSFASQFSQMTGSSGWWIMFVRICAPHFWHITICPMLKKGCGMFEKFRKSCRFMIHTTVFFKSALQTDVSKTIGAYQSMSVGW